MVLDIVILVFIHVCLQSEMWRISVNVFCNASSRATHKDSAKLLPHTDEKIYRRTDAYRRVLDRTKLWLNMLLSCERKELSIWKARNG